MRYCFALLLCLSVTSCVEGSGSESISQLGENSCSQHQLDTAGTSFLSAILEGDVETATEFYAPNHRKSGPGYGVAYTFIPEVDPEAVFDLKAKNFESAIFTEDLGAFEKGRLVGFFQSSAREQTQNITYLRENHWKTFAVCNFVCIDGDWLISDHTCFEDSGSPFK